MFDDPARNLFVLAVIVFLGWFAVGTQLNVRKGNAVLRWLQDGLTLVGEKTTLRWLGSSAVELKVQSAAKPLRALEIFIVLEPRDIPFLWWLFRARGRRDLLILRAQLRAMPATELEALHTRAWSTRGIERSLKAKGWTRIETSPNASLAAYAQGAGETASGLLAVLLKEAAIPELALVRLAVRHSVPNLEVQWRLAGFEKISSRRVFEAVHSIAERV